MIERSRDSPSIGSKSCGLGWAVIVKKPAAQWLQQLRDTPTHLIRLAYTGNVGKWELTFFTYSNEKYSECVFPDGRFEGAPEAGFDIGATYL
ncbi:MAG: hypothetical protein NTW87_36330 [Planctomycetota bacterium]|nr:hypothetical protein [Planctomycetota bacterium]